VSLAPTRFLIEREMAAKIAALRFSRTTLRHPERKRGTSPTSG
jgi:hypothetical protein